MENKVKIKLLRIYEILRNNTDEHHMMTTYELIAALAQDKIKADHRSVKSDIETLNEFGYEIMCEKIGNQNWYYVAELVDFEDSLDRAMLHFSWLEKRTEKISEATEASPAVYRITLFYSKADETEILIRLLSFGPNIRVLYPEPLREKIKERIFSQLALIK